MHDEVGKFPKMQLSRLNNLPCVGVGARESFPFHPVANNLSLLPAFQASVPILGTVSEPTSRFLPEQKVKLAVLFCFSTLLLSSLINKDTRPPRLPTHTPHLCPHPSPTHKINCSLHLESNARSLDLKLNAEDAFCLV